MTIAIIVEAKMTMIWTNKLLLVVLFLCCAAFPALTFSQTKTFCQQDAATQSQLIRDSQERAYVTRRIEVTGNTYVRDEEVMNRFVLKPGDIFTELGLQKSVRNVSKLSSIYPIGLKNVEIILDRQRFDVDLIVCVKERPRKK